jgi:hypothetical protein
VADEKHEDKKPETAKPTEVIAIGGCNRRDHADDRRARRLPRLRRQAERQQEELADEAWRHQRNERAPGCA